MRKNHGTILPLFAMLIIVIVGLSAYVIDFSQGYVNRTKIKNAVDFAALAGISQLTDQSGISTAKNTALQYLNDNLTNSLSPFTPLTLGNSDLSIQAGIYNFNTMTFTPDETNQGTNSLKISYRYNAGTYLANIFGINNISFNENTLAVKQTAGRISPGGGFPLAIQSSQLSVARNNDYMIDLIQTGTANSFFTAFMESTASSSDINQIISYFISQTTGVEPPSLTVGEQFQINNGSLTSVYMNLTESYFEGMTFVAPIVSLPAGFSSTVKVEGFIGFTVNDIYMSGNDYHIAGTIIPGYIDNRWSGLTIGAGPGPAIQPPDIPVLASSFGLVE